AVAKVRRDKESDAEPKVSSFDVSTELDTLPSLVLPNRTFREQFPLSDVESEDDLQLPKEKNPEKINVSTPEASTIDVSTEPEPRSSPIIPIRTFSNQRPLHSIEAEDNLKPPNNPEVCIVSSDEGSSLQNETANILVCSMTTHQVFDCLIRAGCVDLSPQMDPNQDTAMIASGGGFGDIWKGQLHDGTTVAIKAWRVDTLEKCQYKTLKRAARELYYWSKMKHKNIHQLMGVILFRNEYLGMVSEWMENDNLHRYVLKNPGVDRHQLCIEVASGLEYMHSRKTVHGDLKSANVLVSSDGVARLSDFDFSVMSEACSLIFTESSNSRSGSTRWVAPEMLVEDTPKRTTQTDVYALGMVGITYCSKHHVN
ncbi:unnamed protein product, partial [Rhizoctonia solani]